MKILSVIFVLLLTISAATAQTIYVPLNTTGLTNLNYAVPTNAIVSWVGGLTTSQTVNGYTPLGSFKLSQNTGTYTGLTNVALVGQGNFQYATLQITIPTASAVVSNCLPADCIVIPTSQTGSVNVILETSPDLVNWTAASPGLYGPNASAARYFRVHALAQ